MAKKRVNTINPNTNKKAVAVVIMENGSFYTVQFADGSVKTVHKDHVKTF